MAGEFTYACPVCGYAGLTEPPYDRFGCASFDICACCGTEFGYDDSATSHEELRRAWIDAGALWYSKASQPPSDWNAEAQMQAAGIFSQ